MVEVIFISDIVTSILTAISIMLSGISESKSTLYWVLFLAGAWLIFLFLR